MKLLLNDTKIKYLSNRRRDFASQHEGPDEYITPENIKRLWDTPEYKDLCQRQDVATKAKYALKKTTKLIYNILQTRKNADTGMAQDYASIPEKVYVGGKSYIKNPYYNSHFHYSGPPEQFTDWKKQKPKFDQLQAILTRNYVC